MKAKAVYQEAGTLTHNQRDWICSRHKGCAGCQCHKPEGCVLYNPKMELRKIRLPKGCPLK